jgi:hypothetical protein
MVMIVYIQRILIFRNFSVCLISRNENSQGANLDSPIFCFASGGGGGEECEITLYHFLLYVLSILIAYLPVILLLKT